MQRRTRLPARLAALFLMLFVLIGLGSPAAAGGPTSVLIVDHSSGEVTGLYYSDDDYTRLGALLGDPPAGGSKTPTAAEETSRWSGRFVTMTWLIHDISVWRTDQVFPDAADGPWIYTTLMNGDGAMPDSGTWHRPTAPNSLVDLIDKLLAVQTPAAAAPAATAATTVTVTAVATPQQDSQQDPQPSPVAQATSAAEVAGWNPSATLLIGAVGGLVVGAVVARWTARRS